VTDPDEVEDIGVDLSKLRGVRPGEYLIRFSFGAAVSAAAALVAVVFGAKAGGVFLAFPAILPATLTLIEEKEGNRQARADASGGVLGGIGLFAFGAVAYLSLGRVPPAVAVLLALLAWAGVSIGLYLILRLVLPAEP
jgi:hypothetical protein